MVWPRCSVKVSLLNKTIALFFVTALMLTFIKRRQMSSTIDDDTHANMPSANGDTYYVYIYVRSAPSQFDMRNTLRQTWIAEARWGIRERPVHARALQ
jgi:hypothetical protein